MIRAVAPKPFQRPEPAGHDGTTDTGGYVSDVANGSEQIADTIATITASATQTADGAAATQLSAAELATLAGRVQNLVTEFTY